MDIKDAQQLAGSGEPSVFYATNSLLNPDKSSASILLPLFKHDCLLIFVEAVF